MSPGFGEDFKELVRANTNLVDLVSETVALKPLRGGADYVGLCPFHQDRNPSLHVYPDRQSYRCWVCEAGGDVFRWVMEIERLPFPLAIESLARRANLEIPKKSGSNFDPQAEKKKTDSFAVLDWAAHLMHQALRIGSAGENARSYVEKRKLTEETVRGFRLGYHPEEWNWFLERAQGKFTAQQLLAAGLIGERSSGQGYYDNLVGRLVFPILDERGRVVAFGGRVLPGSNIDSPAKYWNSTESSIFHKRRMLYAFDRSREVIRRSKTAIVVEGYMDCIACHQAGVDNVVATLGTAMTEEHVRFLRRFAEQVVLIYDGDSAGQDAAERSIARFLAQDLDLRILTLPDGQDPADFLETNSTEEFRNRITTASEAWEYKLHSIVRRYGKDSINGRQQILTQMMEFIAASSLVPGSLREDLILKCVVTEVQSSETVARQLLKDLRTKNATQKNYRKDENLRRDADPKNNADRESQLQTGTQPGMPSGFESLAEPDPSEQNQTVRDSSGQSAAFNTVRANDLAERELLEIILTCPETIDVIRHRIGPGDFENARHRRLLELCIDVRTEDGDLPEFSRLVIAAESDSELLSLLNAVVDAAEQKGIFRLMNEQPSGHEPTQGQHVPLHLQRVLLPLLDRREKQRHLLSKQRMAQTEASSSELNHEQKDALSRLYSFRLNQMGHRINLK